MKIVLKDGAPRSTRLVEINVSKNGNTLEIGATGVEPAPVVLEFYDGKLRLRLYGTDETPDVVQSINITPNKVISVDPVSLPSAEVVAVLPAPVTTKVNSDFAEAAFDAA